VKYDYVNNKAEFGQLLNVTVITKSGTDRFHGSLFEHFNNQNLAAQSYFSTSQPSFSDHDFGASLGGPVLKKKLFFYGAYEGLRNNTPISINPNVPTVAMRTGDFSSLLVGPNPIVIKNPYTGQPFFDNKISPNLCKVLKARLHKSGRRCSIQPQILDRRINMSVISGQPIQNGSMATDSMCASMPSLPHRTASSFVLATTELPQKYWIADCLRQ